MPDNDTEFLLKLGAKITELRRESGLTQTEMAKRLDVSQQTINSFEKGRRRMPVSTLPKLAQIFGVSLDELVGRKPSARGGKRGPDSRLQRQMEKLQQLPRAKQRMLIEMLDAMIKQAQRQ